MWLLMSGRTSSHGHKLLMKTCLKWLLWKDWHTPNWSRPSCWLKGLTKQLMLTWYETIDTKSLISTSKKTQIHHNNSRLVPQYLGANMLKWTTPDSCLVFSEHDSKLYTNFKILWRKNHRYLKTYWYTKPNKLWRQKKLEKFTYYRRWYKWCASRWYWKNDYLKLV